jgi:predicted transcriptional regulator
MGAIVFEGSQDSTVTIRDFPLLTNHTYVLVLIAQKLDIRMREIAITAGITERAVQRIVEDLTDCGYIAVTKLGRRNRYEIQPNSPLHHPLANHRNIGELIQFVSHELLAQV